MHGTYMKMKTKILIPVSGSVSTLFSRVSCLGQAKTQMVPKFNRRASHSALAI